LINDLNQLIKYLEVQNVDINDIQKDVNDLKTALNAKDIDKIKRLIEVIKEKLDSEVEQIQINQFKKLDLESLKKAVYNFKNNH